MKEKIFRKGIKLSLFGMFLAFAMVLSLMPSTTVKAALHSDATCTAYPDADHWKWDGGTYMDYGTSTLFYTGTAYLANGLVQTDAMGRIGSNEFAAGNSPADNPSNVWWYFYADGAHEIFEYRLCTGHAASHKHAGITFDSKMTKTSGTLSTGNYYLDSDVTLTSNLNISGTVNLCLNGHVLKRAGGNIITIGDSATLNLYDCDTTTEHKGTLSNEGYFWTFDGTGTTTIVGGVITGGKGGDSESDSAITVKGTGTFNMYGGTIAGCGSTSASAPSNAGAVCVNGLSANFNMSGGIIEYCSSFYKTSTNKTRTGAVLVNNSNFKMTGGTIKYCMGSSQGGAVALLGPSGTQDKCFATIDGGTIENCKSLGQGAGICMVRGTLKFQSGIIRNCNAPTGVAISLGDPGIVNISGGTITGNHATDRGGAIRMKTGTLTMTGGTITGNIADNSAGGIECTENIAGISLGGTAVITGNKVGEQESNVYLGDGKCITLVEPTPTMKVGVTTKTPAAEGAPVKFVASSGNNTNCKYFIPDKATEYIVLCSGGKDYTTSEVEISGCHTSHSSGSLWMATHEHDGITFGKALSADGGTLSNGNYYLDRDITLSRNITISGTVNLCLNGHVLKGTGSGSVITVNAGSTLNLYNCDDVTEHKGTISSHLWTWDGGYNTGDTVIKGGVITGGATSPEKTAGAITVNGTLNMNGGTIAGNKHNVEHSGGVRVNVGGAFTMNSGEIKYNTAGRSGGAVFMNGGTFTMNDGIITSNYAGHGGGGVYLLTGCTFTMNNGEISNNISHSNNGGGGVRNESGSVFTMNGGTIKNNTSEVNQGGGVNSAGDFTMNGGVITGNTTASNGGGVYSSGNLTVGGTAQITGNKKGGDANNVYLAASKTIAVSSTNSPASGMKIGVTTATAPTTGNPVKIATGANSNNYKYFESDKSGAPYVVLCDGSKDYDINGKELVGCHSSHTANTAWLSLHAHSWNYTVGTGDDANKITAKCEGYGDCTVTNGKTTGVTLTLSASTTGYTGSAIMAEYGAGEALAWRAAMGTDAPAVTYEYKATADGTYAAAAEAKDAGYYKASVTVAGKTASVEFQITPASQDAPAAGVGYTIDYAAETITAGTDYEVSTSNETLTAPEGGKVAPGTTYYVRKKGDNNHSPSAWVSFTTEARPTAPTGLAGVSPTTVDGTDGKITGTAATMEYKLSTADAWTAATDTEVTGLAAGTYKVRVKATETTFASEEATVTVAPHEHGTAATWVKTATTHKEVYDCCGAVKTAETNHVYGTTGAERYTCSVCTYEDATKKAEAELADAKEASKAAIDAEVGDDTSDNVKKAADDAKAAIDNATTVADVTTAKDAGIEAIKAAKAANALAAAKEAAKAAIDTAVDGDTTPEVVAAANEAKEAIDAATTLTSVSDAELDGIAKIAELKHKNVLEEVKKAAKEKIDNEVGGDTSANVKKAADDAKAAIDAATSVDDVKTETDKGIEAIEAAKAANALAAAKEAAKAAIDTEVGDDISANVKKAADDAKAAIDAADTTDAVTAAKEAGIEAIKAAKAANALAAAKEAAKAAIDAEVGDDTSDNVKKAADDAKAAIDNATTVADVTTAKDAGIEAIKAAKAANALAAAKEAAKKAIADEKGDDTSANVVKAAEDANKAIEDATTIDAVTTAKEAGIEAIRAAKAANGASALEAAKDAAKKAIDAEVGNDTTPEVAAAAKAAKDAIDKATTLTGVSDAELDGISKIAELKHINMLDEVKKAAKAEIDNLVGNDASAEVKKAAEAAKAEIDAAKTVKDVEAATDKGINAIEAAKAEIDKINAAKDAAKKAIDAEVGNDTTPEVLAAAKAAKDAIDKATTLTAISDAELDGISKIAELKHINMLDEVKKAAKAEIDSLVGNDTSAEVKKAAEAAKAEIDAAKTVKDVEAATDKGINAIEAAKKNNKVPEFKDVVKDAWYEKGVQYVSNFQFMFGYDDPVTKLPTGVFGIKDALTRGQFAVIMYRIAGEPETTYTSKYVDLSEDKYYAKAVAWGTANGVLTGYLDGSGRFGGDEPIKRQDAALILYRYEKLYLKKDVSNNATFDSFKDGDTVSKYAADAMKWAVASGVITGKNNVTLDPKAIATREEGATMIMRFLNR